MKRLSISLPAIMLALVLALSGAALTPIASSSSSTIAPTPVSAAGVVAAGIHSRDTRQIYYYWYTSPDDQYNDYNDEDDEMWEWEMLLGGVSINTNPVGGTLIACGYYNNTNPHNNFPAEYIYAHYIY